MPRTFDVSAEFPVDAATFVKDSTSEAYKAYQLRRMGNPQPAVVLSDTRRDGWHVTVRACERGRALALRTRAACACLQ
jgi:hypothetical protein